MDPKENLEKTIEELTTEEVVETPQMEAVAEEVAVRTPSVETGNPVASEPVAPEAPRADSPVFADKPKKKGAGMVLGMVLLALLAAGGIGFGVWAMIDKNTEVDRLNKQISELQNQSVDYEEETIVDIETNNGDVETDNITPSAVDTAKYIYVGEWGVKFRIPDNLERVSYEIENWETERAAGTALCVAGATTGHGDQVPSFVKNWNIGASNYVCISKNTRSSSDEHGSIDEMFPVGEYVVRGPQSMTGDGSDMDWEAESVNAIVNMLSTDNMSAI